MLLRMEGVSSLVEVPRFRGMGVVDPYCGNEAVIESRWAIPMVVSFQSCGMVQIAACTLQEVTRGDDGIFRYRIRVVGEHVGSILDDAHSADLDSAADGTGSDPEYPGA